MNERYGRNPQQGSRNRYGDERNREDYDAPRQPQQWHDETIGQQGGWHEDQARNRCASGQDGHSSYGDSRYQASRLEDERPRSYGAGDRESRSAYGQEYRGYGRYGGDYYGERRADLYGGRQEEGFRSFSGSDYGGRDFAWDAPAPYGVYGGYAGADRAFYGRDRDGYRAGSRGYGMRDYSGWREYGERRGFFERAGDEIASWFGDEDAARRREKDHRGRGPANYTRSDERIREDANDALTRDWAVDASEITVKVQNGEVTLDGTVHSRVAKRRAEDCVDDVSGVRHVQNNLRVRDAWSAASDTSKATSASTAGTSTAR